MNFLHDLSLSYKTPLRICALVIVTAVLVTASWSCASATNCGAT
ncbi:hypothetical protein [Ramlibacter montanisoli]|nr:hypothetical protein [Ramlibacter montanisoli]